MKKLVMVLMLAVLIMVSPNANSASAATGWQGIGTITVYDVSSSMKWGNKVVYSSGGYVNICAYDAPRGHTYDIEVWEDDEAGNASEWLGKSYDHSFDNDGCLKVYTGSETDGSNNKAEVKLLVSHSDDWQSIHNQGFSVSD